MAKVRVPQGPFGLQGFERSEELSRVVSCSHYDPAPPGQDFAYTEAVAQNLRLLSIDIFLDTNVPFAQHVFTFSVWRMTAIPANLLAVYQTENIMPVQSTTGIWYWHAYGPDKHFHWSMNRRFKGVGQRFGVVLTGAGAVIAQIHASFEISEG